MRILITAGPTHEPIDAVRFIGNRSSGKMGLALAQAAVDAGHQTTVIAGPISISFPTNVRRIDVETTAQMHDAVLREFVYHDLLIMAAAVADFRLNGRITTKLPRAGRLTLELVATDDILAAAVKSKRPDQRTIAFSLEDSDDLNRALAKLLEKHADLIVHNPMRTIASSEIHATLLYPDGRTEPLGTLGKEDFARVLLERAGMLFGR